MVGMRANVWRGQSHRRVTDLTSCGSYRGMGPGVSVEMAKQYRRRTGRGGCVAQTVFHNIYVFPGKGELLNELIGCRLGVDVSALLAGGRWPFGDGGLSPLRARACKCVCARPVFLSARSFLLYPSPLSQSNFTCRNDICSCDEEGMDCHGAVRFGTGSVIVWFTRV